MLWIFMLWGASMTPEHQQPKEPLEDKIRYTLAIEVPELSITRNEILVDRIMTYILEDSSRPHPASARTAEHMQSAYAHGVMDGEHKAREDVLNRLDKEIAIRENEMNRKGNLEDNLTTATGYLTAAGALNWVRVVLIDGSRDTIDGDALRSTQQQAGDQHE